MKTILFLTLTICAHACDKMDYEMSAKEKTIRYAQFLQVMDILQQEEESELANRRQYPQLRIVIKDEDDDWFMLDRSDFEAA